MSVPSPSPSTLAPGDTFQCARLHCRLTAAACVARQDAYRAGNGYGDRVPAYPMCAGGTCADGVRVRARLPAGWAPPEFRETRSDLPDQARARRQALRSRIDDVTIDAPPRAEAARDAEAPRPAPARAAAPAAAKDPRPPPPARQCSACAKPLRISSKGDLCYRCHVRAGHAVPGRPDLTAVPGHAPAPAPPPARSGLPDPSELPVEYLVRCVVVAAQLRVRIHEVLGGDLAVVAAASPGHARRSEGSP
jgi:hypothetical protein